LIGVNNQYRGRSAEEFRAQFRALLARAVGFAGSQASRVVVVSIPDWGVTPFARASGRDARTTAHEIDAFNEIGRLAAAEAGAHFVDVTAVSRSAGGQSDMIVGDGLHPSAHMYDVWTRLILPVAVEAVGRQRDTANDGEPVQSAHR
jgi:lysophospholipase L1-like esterase